MKGRLISLFHEEGQIETITNQFAGVSIQGKLPLRYLTKYKKFIVDGFIP